MIGCSSGGRGGGGGGSGGSRNPAFNSSTTPISESVEMMMKHSWTDTDGEYRRNDVDNNGAAVVDVVADADETRVRIHDDDENNGLTTIIFNR